MGVKLYKRYLETKDSHCNKTECKESKNTKKDETINDKIQSLSKYYKYNESDGSFGEHNPGSGRVYNIKVNEPPEKVARKFWNVLSNGGLIENKGYGLEIATLKDGTVITYRSVTKSGPPAIEINVRKTKIRTNIKNFKIHFIKEDNK